jgi:hypothetical protein
MASLRFRTTLVLTLALGLLAFFPLDVLARGGGRASSYSPHSSSSSGTSHHSTHSSSRSPIKCESCPRDNHGKIKRDPNAMSEFKRTNLKPPGCHQCEVDHIVPLSKGGRGDPSNMQWLPKDEHKEKRGGTFGHRVRRIQGRLWDRGVPRILRIIQSAMSISP